MRAVWSFWQAPYADYRAASWGSEKSHLLAWILSLETARRHYPATTLITDDAGAGLLVDGLGLEFDTVSLGLNVLEGYDPVWWSIGKLVAIAQQDEPFVHIDPDVFLWSPLPAELSAAPVFAQNPELFSWSGSYYRPDYLEHALSGVDETWLPEEWGWHATPGVAARGECCGIVGGTRPDFLRHYARQALRIVNEPGNAARLRSLDHHVHPLTITVEQYLLAACVEHHRGRPGSPYRDVRIGYLFDSWSDAFDDENAAEAGYTHLMADAKRAPEIAWRLDQRVRRDYPKRYERCLEYLDVASQP
jgi:hypothetical protein